MGYEISIIAGYTTFLLVVFTAWVGGYLDPLQHSLQDIILGKMGDNRVSYGAKSKSQGLSNSHQKVNLTFAKVS